MNTYTIEREIEIEAPVDVVWRTITEPEQIPAWFSDEAELEARPGAVGTLTFRGDGTGDPKVADITIVAVERPHRFVFRWSNPPGTQATPDNSMLVTFTLAAIGDARTALRVVESGLDGLDWSDDDKQSYADDHRNGWQVVTGRLRDLFVSGHDSSP